MQMYLEKNIILASKFSYNGFVSRLRHTVGGHAVVVLAVAARRPQKQRRRHHVQRRGNQSQIERPPQRAVHLIGEHGDPVEQVHPSQVTAHRG